MSMCHTSLQLISHMKAASTADVYIVLIVFRMSVSVWGACLFVRDGTELLRPYITHAPLLAISSHETPSPSIPPFHLSHFSLCGLSKTHENLHISQEHHRQHDTNLPKNTQTVLASLQSVVDCRT